MARRQTTIGGRARRLLSLLLIASFALRAFSLTAHMLSEQHAFDPLTGLFHHLHSCDHEHGHHHGHRHSHEHGHQHSHDHDLEPPVPVAFFHDAGEPTSRAGLRPDAGSDACNGDCAYNFYFNQSASQSDSAKRVSRSQPPRMRVGVPDAPPRLSRLMTLLQAPKNSPPYMA